MWESPCLSIKRLYNNFNLCECFRKWVNLLPDLSLICMFGHRPIERKFKKGKIHSLTAINYWMKVFSNTKIKLLLKRSQRTYFSQDFHLSQRIQWCELWRLSNNMFGIYKDIVDFKKNLTMSLQCKKNNGIWNISIHCNIKNPNTI